MTPKTLSKSHIHPHTGTRGVLRVVVPSATLLSALVVAPAAIAAPEGWSQPDDVSAMQFLLVLLLLPVAAVALITLLVYAPALVRGQKSGSGTKVEDQWIGGPRTDKGELTSKQTEETGGASARW